MEQEQLSEEQEQLLMEQDQLSEEQEQLLLIEKEQQLGLHYEQLLNSSQLELFDRQSGQLVEQLVVVQDIQAVEHTLLPQQPGLLVQQHEILIQQQADDLHADPELLMQPLLKDSLHSRDENEEEEETVGVADFVARPAEVGRGSGPAVPGGADESAPHVGSPRMGGRGQEEDSSLCPTAVEATPPHNGVLASSSSTRNDAQRFADLDSSFASSEDLADDRRHPVAPHRRRSFRRAHSHSPSHGGGGGVRQLSALLNNNAAGSTATVNSTASHISERMNMFRELPQDRATSADKRPSGGDIFRAALERLSFRRSSKKKKKDKKSRDEETKCEVTVTKATTNLSDVERVGDSTAKHGGGVRELKETLGASEQPAVMVDVKADPIVDAVEVVKNSIVVDNRNNNDDVKMSEACTPPPSSPPPLQAGSSHTKPPLPPGRSRRIPPASAQWEQSRPLNQLDAALQQFKRSAAESRENLALSRPDISLIQAGLADCIQIATLFIPYPGICKYRNFLLNYLFILIFLKVFKIFKLKTIVFSLIKFLFSLFSINCNLPPYYVRLR